MGQWVVSVLALEPLQLKVTLAPGIRWREEYLSPVSCQNALVAADLVFRTSVRRALHGVSGSRLAARFHDESRGGWVGEYRLEVRQFQDLSRWRWALTGPGGVLVAEHEVRLDAGCWQFEAFGDLRGYLRWHAAPDRRIEDETRIVTWVGEWIGAEVLGPVAGALAKARPGTVRVSVPPGEPAEAQELLFRPLELADVGGTPLALQDVTMVMETGGAQGTAPVGERLRVLGLFSMPVGARPLNLRRERHTLVRMLREIGARGRAVDVRVLQYGVTRGRRREMLEEDEGWDVIHVSGHGMPGELILEKADGSPDRMTATELADLLDLARERLKLVTVSACWSAALTAADQRRLSRAARCESHDHW